jgi:Fe-S cluster biogenesis protein NfuA
MTQHEILDSALDPLRAGLEADNFELRLLSLEADGRARVSLNANPGACLDCLVPEDLLIEMIGDRLRKSEPTVETVELVKTGFEAATHAR